MSISVEDVGKLVEKIDKHIGRNIWKQLVANKDEINQINMTTGETETHGSVLLRSIRVAQALTKRNIGHGKILMLCGVNHNDIGIPMTSAFFIGTTIMTLSVDMKYMEIKQMMVLGNPDIVFCDSDVAKKFATASFELNISPEIVVFGDLPEGKFTPFAELSSPTGTENKFAPADFDPAKTNAFIVLSSGTTGMPKGVCLTHQNITIPLLLPIIMSKFTLSFKNSMVSFSSIVWLTGILMHLMSDMFGVIRIHTHLPFSPERAFEAINKYKPQTVFLSPTGITTILRHPKINECDFSCIKSFAYGGSSISSERIEELQKYIPNGMVGNFYGMTETTGGVCRPMKYKKNSCGLPLPWVQWKVVDPITKQEMGPNEVGEMYIKSPWVMFNGYYKNPEATAAAFDGDWYRTGDLVYYDEEQDFFVVDRIKEMIKFRNIQIAPAEVEKEITKIPEVIAACVVSIPHPDDGEHPAAFVQLIPGSKVTAQDINQMIEENLSDHKQLRGGIKFLDKFPETHSGKINRKVLNEMKLSSFTLSS